MRRENKLFLGIVFLVVGLALYAPALCAFELSLGFDSDDQWYGRAAVQTSLQLGEFGLGIDLGLRWSQGQFYAEPLLHGIRYLRWRSSGAPLYLQVGMLESVRLGTGVLMSNYANLSPAAFRRGERLLGLEFGARRPGGGGTVVINDLLAPGLIAGRVFLLPLDRNKSSRLSSLEVGFSYIGERRYGADGPQAQALDVRMPLTSWLVPYGELAHIRGQASAVAVGIGSNRASTLGWRLEYRTFQAGFVPNLFSSNYEQLAQEAWGDAQKGYDLFSPLSEPTTGWLAEFSYGRAGAISAVIRREVQRLPGGGFSGPEWTASLTLPESSLKPIVGRRAFVSVQYVRPPDAVGRLHVDGRLALWGKASLHYGYRWVLDPEGAASTRLQLNYAIEI